MFEQDKYYDTCAECGSNDVFQGYDVMMPINKKATIDHYKNGEYSGYFWCNNCGEECSINSTLINDYKEPADASKSKMGDMGNEPEVLD